MERLIAHSSNHLALYIRLALNTAGRPEAILGLTWDTHIKLEEGLIWLGFKAGGKARATVPINDGTRAVLVKAFQAHTSPYVIEFRGKPIKNIRWALIRACERAGIEPISPYVLRHTAAVWMAMAGTSMEEIAELMGHSDIRITRRHYVQYTPDFLKGAVEVLEV